MYKLQQQSTTQRQPAHTAQGSHADARQFTCGRGLGIQFQALVSQFYTCPLSHNGCFPYRIAQRTETRRHCVSAGRLPTWLLQDIRKDMALGTRPMARCNAPLRLSQSLSDLVGPRVRLENLHLPPWHRGTYLAAYRSPCLCSLPYPSCLTDLCDLYLSCDVSRCSLCLPEHSNRESLPTQRIA